MGKWRGRCGCLGCAGGILGFILLMMFGLPILLGIFYEDTWFLPGDARNFDVTATFAEVQKHAGDDVQLVSIEAYYVRSDGTIDLKAEYTPYVRYTFVRELDEPPDDAPPIGAGGNLDDRWYERVEVMVERPWKSWSVTSGGSSYTYYNLGMDRDTSDPAAGLPGNLVPPPTCPFAMLWEKAMQRDTPRSAVAVIRYDEQGYHFSVNSTPYNFDFDFDCNLKG